MTVQELVDKLNFLIENNYIKPTDEVIIASNKISGPIKNVSVPKVKLAPESTTKFIICFQDQKELDFKFFNIG